PTNYTLDFFSDAGSYRTELYDGDFLVGDLYEPLVRYRTGYLTPYTSTTGRFLLTYVDFSNTYFFRLREIYTKNCLDESNVIIVYYYFDNLILQNKADDQCLLTFLLSRPHSGMELIFNDVILPSNVTFYPEYNFNY